MHKSPSQKEVGPGNKLSSPIPIPKLGRPIANRLAATPRSGRIIQADHAGFADESQDLGVTGPVDYRVQCSFRIRL